MKRILFALFMVMACLVPATAMAEIDNLFCTESDNKLFCSLKIPNFIQNVQTMLASGWENTIQISIALQDASNGKTLNQSYLEATQRCYLDPFESPCLILWKGATVWQRYRDDYAFLSAFSHFSIQAMSLEDIEPGNYKVRIIVQIMPSAQKRMNSIQSWYKSSSSDSGAGAFSTGSLISSVLSSRAESVEKNIYHTVLETTQFYIDPESNPENAQITDEIPEENDAAQEPEQSSETDSEQPATNVADTQASSSDTQASASDTQASTSESKTESKITENMDSENRPE